jgi:NhaP-type Na+/H+ and K+/H+ antiporter
MSLLVPVLAALCGFLVHSQVDTPLWIPSIALVVMLLLALGAHGAGALQPGKGPLSRWAICILALAVPLFGFGLKAIQCFLLLKASPLGRIRVPISFPFKI